MQADLKNYGKFEGGKFHPASGGEPKDGCEATWEHYNKCKLEYPKPRYTRPILMKPENFTWKEDCSVGSTESAYRKHLGTFTERAVLAEMIKVEKGGRLELKPINGVQLVFVYKGEGELGGEKLVKESALRLEPGQQATISSMSNMEALHLVLPAF